MLKHRIHNGEEIEADSLAEALSAAERDRDEWARLFTELYTLTEATLQKVSTLQDRNAHQRESIARLYSEIDRLEAEVAAWEREPTLSDFREENDALAAELTKQVLENDEQEKRLNIVLAENLKLWDIHYLAGKIAKQVAHDFRADAPPSFAITSLAMELTLLCDAAKVRAAV